jgi:hypothetical protein
MAATAALRRLTAFQLVKHLSKLDVGFVSKFLFQFFPVKSYKPLKSQEKIRTLPYLALFQFSHAASYSKIR